MKKAKFVVENTSEEAPKQVTLTQADDGVILRINGNAVLELHNGLDFVDRYIASPSSGLRNAEDGYVATSRDK